MDENKILQIGIQAHQKAITQHIENSFEKAQSPSGKQYGDPIGTIKEFKGVKYIKKGPGNWIPYKATAEKTYTTEIPKNLNELRGKTATFDHPDNPHSRWAKVFKIDKESKRIFLEHVGWGFASELKGIKKEEKTKDLDKPTGRISSEEMSRYILPDVASAMQSSGMTKKQAIEYLKEQYLEKKIAENKEKTKSAPKLTEQLVKDTMMEIQSDFDTAFPPLKDVLKELKKKGIDVDDPEIRQKVKNFKSDIMWDINRGFR